ncbi:MAG TPA: carboxypeptidase-like regulatory domain-containing protein [Candidatus Limnocylindrales bacterium]|nr:carboxypeptidase-like regulatory domain-containing protein [Candidatus Limnocylindrales bacterium]
MIAELSRMPGFLRLIRVTVCLLTGFLAGIDALAQQPAAAASGGSPQEVHEAGPPRRIPRQQALTTAALDGTVREQVSEGVMRPVGGAQIQIRNLQTGQVSTTLASGEGVFRLLLLPPGGYELRAEAGGHEALTIASLSLNANEVVTLDIRLVANSAAEARSRLPRQPELGPPLPADAEGMAGSYREFRHRLDSDPNYILELSPDVLPPISDVFNVVPNRWALEQPDYRRYRPSGEYIYTKPHWYDPFNRNRYKGDEPIWPAVLGQQVFLNVTASETTFIDGRKVPSPSNVSAAQAGSSEFFGRGEQFFLDQTFRFTFDLFHGDASFKPVDWRFRVTPEVSLNYLDVKELGIVGPDVRAGTTRLDSHVGFQEAFLEYKLRDLSPNYDFISVRAGIQEFNADFRGFLFVDEQPALRVFGDLKSDRLEYNAAYFNFLEKNTNSGLNTFSRRNQQVMLGNIYIQDFFFPGYTAEFLGAYNKDDGGLHYDDNGFLVRPAPIGSVINQGVGAIPHSIQVGYFGWLGSGHIKRLNITHAFYEAAGKDSFNPISGKPVTVNAQMAAVELSLDRDWIRYRISTFYASGDHDPRNGRANGFDAIVDLPSFAGGLFSFWNREGIRLLGSGVSLTTDGSLLPNMRSNKNEGQANFVNPGIFLVNAGTDIDITPKLKGFVNFNYLRFMRTEPLEIVLFQSPIRHNIGEDFGVGVTYRPPLSENIILTGGASMLQPGQGFRDIYTGRTLFSVFGSAKLTF